MPVEAVRRTPRPRLPGSSSLGGLANWIKAIFWLLSDLERNTDAATQNTVGSWPVSVDSVMIVASGAPRVA